MKKIFTLIAMMVLAITANAEVRSWDFTKGANYPQVAEDAANWKVVSKGRYSNANALDNQALIVDGETFVLTNGLTFKCDAEKVMFGITGEYYMQCQGTVVMTIPNVAKGDTLVLGVCSSGKSEATVSGNISESISELSSKKQIYTVIATEAGDLALTMNNRVRLYTLDVKPAPADFSALAQLIAQAQEMDKEELAQAIADAICVWDTPTSTQEQVDAAVEELQAAIDALPKDVWVDVTAQYLSMYDFDSHFDVTVDSEATDLTDFKVVPFGWEATGSIAAGVSGIFQYGSPVTVKGASLPTAGYDGSSDGGMFVLRPTAKLSTFHVAITEDNKLPVGDYIVEFPYYYFGTANKKHKVFSRWNNTNPVPEGGEKIEDVYSSTYGDVAAVLPYEQWYADSLKFTLTEPAKGNLVMSLSWGAYTGAAQGGICIDYVKILYKPVSASVLAETIAKAQALNIINETLKSAIADAVKVLVNADATQQDFADAVVNLEDAIYAAETSISDVTVKNAPKAKKAMVNGKIVIVKNGKMFNIAGVEQK